MSETRHRKGKLELVWRPTGRTLEQQCEYLYVKEKPSWATTYQEAFLSDNYEQYIAHDGDLYKVVEDNEIDVDDDMYNIKKISDTEVEFEVKYYDGGCSFDEAIEYAFGNLK